MNVLSTTVRSALGLGLQVATYTGRYVISTAKEFPISAATAAGLCAFQATGRAFSCFVPNQSHAHLDKKLDSIAAVAQAFCVLGELSHLEINPLEFANLKNALPKDLEGLTNDEKRVFERLNHELSSGNQRVNGLTKDEQIVLVNFYEKVTRESRERLGSKAAGVFTSLKEDLLYANSPLICADFLNSAQAFEEKCSLELREYEEILSNNRFTFWSKMGYSAYIGALAAYNVWLQIMSLNKDPE